MNGKEQGFVAGVLVSSVALGGLVTGLAFANVAAREQLSAELLGDTYGDCLPEEAAHPELAEMSYSLLGGQAIVNASVEGDTPYIYQFELAKDGEMAIIPGDDHTWRALSEAGCVFPEVE